MKMTVKQSELWELADSELQKIGGLGRITRNPDVAIRNRAKTEGMKEWALCQTICMTNVSYSDEQCQNLINIIKG